METSKRSLAIEVPEKAAWRDNVWTIFNDGGVTPINLGMKGTIPARKNPWVDDFSSRGRQTRIARVRF